MKIYIIRHGESSHNADRNKLSGSTDVKLTPTGINQCISLSRHFVGFDAQILASPLERSIVSAQYIFPHLKSSIKIIPEITEFDYGDYEGVCASELPNDPIIKQWNEDPSNLTFPNGDSVEEHASKILRNLKNLAEGSSKNSLCCVSHRTTIRLLVAKIMDIPLSTFRKIPCDNCHITQLKFEKGQFSVSMLNASPHFNYKE